MPLKTVEDYCFMLAFIALLSFNVLTLTLAVSLGWLYFAFCLGDLALPIGLGGFALSVSLA